MKTSENLDFGKGKKKAEETKPVPDVVDNLKEFEKASPQDKFTPESVQNDEELMSKLPRPTGYRMLVLPFTLKPTTKGGIILSNETLERERLATNVGFVVSLGPDAYKDKSKFPEGPWCKAKDWIIFGRYAGARIKIDGGDLRLLNDDDILAVIDSPEDVLGDIG